MYEIIISLVGLCIIFQSAIQNKKINNIVILEKAIHPIYHDIARIRNILNGYKNEYHNDFIDKDKSDEYKYQEFIRTPNVERFRNLLIQCEIYLDKKNYNMIHEYELDINRFFSQHMLIEDYTDAEYALECLSIDDAYDLFDNLLATIKTIKKRYNNIINWPMQ